MTEYVSLLVMGVLGFCTGYLYAGMKSQRKLDELAMKVTELNAQNRLVKRLQDRIESKLDQNPAP